MHKTHGDGEHAAMRIMGLSGLGLGAVSLTPIITHALSPLGSQAWSASEFAINSCGSAVPVGWASDVANVVSQMPAIGPTLAAGGPATIATAAGLAIAGMVFGHFLDKHSKPGGFPWGKALRWGLLITSTLVAAPMILSGATMGLTFLGAYFGVGAFSSLASTFGTLGTSSAFSGAAMAKGSAAIMGVHALTCVLPMGLSGFLLGKKPEENAKPMPLLQPGGQLQGKLVLPVRAQAA
jgi:hypothetical protein